MRREVIFRFDLIVSVMAGAYRALVRVFHYFKKRKEKQT
jgi:hypothetical protein